MFLREAQWLGDFLTEKVVNAPEAHVINLGSQSLHFRTSVQPYIHTEIFAPLADLGIAITHVDLVPDPGVDLVLNLTDEHATQRLLDTEPSIVLVCNLLEHVEDPSLVIAMLKVIASRGALIVVSGPRYFPYHPDPIDNSFRPSKRELCELFLPLQITHYQRFWAFGVDAAVGRGFWTLAIPRSWARYLVDRLRKGSSVRPPWHTLRPVLAFGAVFRA